MILRVFAFRQYASRGRTPKLVSKLSKKRATGAHTGKPATYRRVVGELPTKRSLRLT